MALINRILWLALIIVLMSSASLSWAWTSGEENTAGPSQARKVLGPLDGGNEHGYLMLEAFQQADVPEELINRTLSFPVYLTRPLVSSDPISLMPTKFRSVETVTYRHMNISGFSALADHSYSIWDWANGNEICPLGTTDGPATAKDCHTFTTHLGIVNSNHFVPQAGNTYRWYHELAMSSAANCADQKMLLKNSPLYAMNAQFLNSFIEQCQVYTLALEAFGQHFLQDLWAVGHMWEGWGAPDLRRFPGSDKRAKAALVGFVRGLIHGCQSVCGFPDALSGGTDRAYLDPNFEAPFPLPGIGDFHLFDGLYGDPKYQRQKNQFYECMISGVLQVYGALGETSRMASANPIGDGCLRPRNTNDAIYRGWWLGTANTIRAGVIGPFLIVKNAKVTVPLLLKLKFTRDVTKFEIYMKIKSILDIVNPQEPDYEKFPTIVGVEPNSFYARVGITPLVPAAPYADPSTMHFSLLNPVHLETLKGVVNNEIVDIDTEISLMRLFNKAHLAPLCTEPESDPFVLSDRVGLVRNTIDLPAACGICTEIAARHMQLPSGSKSMCEEVGEDEVGGGGPVIDDFTPKNIASSFVGQSQSPLERAAIEWCGCTVVGAEVHIRELQTRVDPPRFDSVIASVSGLLEPPDNLSLFDGVPGCTLDPRKEVGEPVYSDIVIEESENQATLYPATLTSQNVVQIFNPNLSFNRATCSSFVATRNFSGPEEQVWINIAERIVTFAPGSDREYQIRFYSGDPGIREFTKRCEGGWADVNVNFFNKTDDFDCDYRLLYE